MTVQSRLLDPGEATGNMTAKQTIVHTYLQEHQSGAFTIDIGRHLHRTKPNPCLYCSDKTTCQYASRDANQVLDSLRGRPNDPKARRLVVRRRDGRWELRAKVRQPDDTPIPF